MVVRLAIWLPLSVTGAAAAAPAIPVTAVADAVVRLPVAIAAVLSFIPVAGTPGSFPVGCRRRRRRSGRRRRDLLDEVESHLGVDVPVGVDCVLHVHKNNIIVTYTANRNIGNPIS